VNYDVQKFFRRRISSGEIQMATILK